MLLMLFPAAIILAIYSVLVAVPLQNTKSELEAEFVRQQNAAVSRIDADNSLQVLTNERQSLERLKKRISTSKQQIRELSQSWRSRKSRLETIEKISELMRDYNLSIDSMGDEEGMIVSTYLRELFQIMDNQSNDDPVEFWQVKVTGAYFEVADFLAAVDTTAKKIVPIGITMEPDESSSRKKWTIVFVI